MQQPISFLQWQQFASNFEKIIHVPSSQAWLIFSLITIQMLYSRMVFWSYILNSVMRKLSLSYLFPHVLLFPAIESQALLLVERLHLTRDDTSV